MARLGRRAPEVHTVVTAQRRAIPWNLFALAAIATALGTALFFAVAEPLREPFELDRALNLAEGIGTYITITGVVYALMVGFTFQQAIERQRDLRTAVHREAGSLNNIVLLLEVMQHGEALDRVGPQMEAYLDRLLKTAEGEGGEAEIEEATRDLYGMLPELNELASDGLDDEIDRVTLRAVHEELREVSRAHSDMLAIRQARLPTSQWFALGFLALLLSVGFLFLDLNVIRLESVLFGFVLASVVVLMSVIRDLDDPGHGMWRVDLGAIQAVREELAKVIVARKAWLTKQNGGN